VQKAVVKAVICLFHCASYRNISYSGDRFFRMKAGKWEY